MKDNKICMLLVDDEKRMVMGLRDYFKSKGFIVYAAYDGQEALEIFYKNSTEIDVILLDIMMPIMDGIQVLEELRNGGVETPVIMLTARGEEYDQLTGFQKGADDYVVKPFSTSILLARVETLLKRANKNLSEELKCGEIGLDLQKKTVLVHSKEVEMTRREFELLHYMILNKGIALSREQLLEKVWGYEYEGDPRTIDTHIKQVRMKLDGCGHYIKTVRMVGYLFEVEE
ncbi:MAG: response regulator transcription factor [Eubacteriales bacterium]